MVANRGSGLAHGLLVVLSIVLFCLAITLLAIPNIAFAVGLLIAALVAAIFGLQIRPNYVRAREGRLLAASWLFFGLLTLIFTPIYAGQGSRSAKEVHCLSNVKQLGVGMLMYAADYDDHFPLANSWHEGLIPYTKNDDLFQCPVAISPWSYAIDASMAGTHAESIKAPELQVLLFEGNAALPNASGGREWLVPRHPSRELPRATIGFVDGHAKNLTAVEAAKLNW